MKIENELPGVKRNILLKNYTTFKIGGPAKYFYKAENKEDLVKAILVTKKLKLPFFVLGGGSNLLVSDKGFDGLVIKQQAISNKRQDNKIFTEAGLALNQLVNIALKNNLSGLEWAVGIPGTVGGAIRGNAGAFGSSMKGIVEGVEIYDSKNGKLKTFKNKDCQFDYRESVFKRKPNLIILSANLQLKKGDRKEIQKKIKEYLSYRKKTQPLEFPSAGSIFKNSPGFSAGELGEEDKSSSSPFAAARLIEKCGLKGKKIGDVKVSEIHANFIVNLGEGKARDVIKLIKLIKKEVKNKFKVELEEEIQYLGF